MATALTKLITSTLYRIVFYQLLIIMGFMLVLFMLKDVKSGLSLLAGGLTYWLPTFIFTRGIASCAGAQATGRFMITFFVGEALKLVLCGALFVFFINQLHVQITYAVAGLIIAIIAFWLSSMTCLYQSETA